MSGVKGRSGRKRDASVLSVREVIDRSVTAADWVKMWRKVSAAAKKGDLQAMRFLTEYRYGGPQKEAPPPAVRTPSVTYYLPYREGDKLPRVRSWSRRVRQWTRQRSERDKQPTGDRRIELAAPLETAPRPPD